MWGTLKPPSPIPHLVSRRRLKDFLKIARPTKQMFIDEACWIVNEHIRDRSFEGGLQAYLNVVYSIDQAKIQAMGKSASTLVCNILMQFVAYTWMARTTVEDASIGLIDSIMKNVKDHPFACWFYPKLFPVRNALISKTNTMLFAFQSELSDSQKQRLTDLERTAGKSLRVITNEVVEALHRNRDYSVKPCYFQDGILHEDDKAWLFASVDDLRSPELDPLGFLADNFVWIQLAQRDAIRGVATENQTEVINQERNIAVSKIAVDALALFAWLYDRNGEMSIDGYGIIPVRDVFVSVGKEGVYDIIRYSLTMQLYDLVVPIKIVRGLPSLPTHRTRRPTEPSAIEDLLDPKLLLPRIKILGNSHDLTAAMDAEIEESEERARRRSPRQHECIGGVRELPPGKHASPAAKELALKAGIVLEPNETFVKKHPRGKGGLVIPRHEAVRPRARKVRVFK
ncbi:hypothetical protein KBB27_03505 [Patescibacteria group bacterium]|nr:hypothetical protein [Patescibacteria group bacterium]